jgi:hypothetical protein
LVPRGNSREALVDRDEQQRMERLNREAAAEKRPDDPTPSSRATPARSS